MPLQAPSSRQQIRHLCEVGARSRPTLPVGAHAYSTPDGLCFDSEGGIWVTSIVSNRVIRIAPDGSQSIVLEDDDPAHLDWVEKAFQAGIMNRPHLDQVKSRRLRNISSLAFAGPDLSEAYLGCLQGDSLARFKSPIPGHPPTHWNFPGPNRISGDNSGA